MPSALASLAAPRGGSRCAAARRRRRCRRSPPIPARCSRKRRARGGAARELRRPQPGRRGRAASGALRTLVGAFAIWRGSFRPAARATRRCGRAHAVGRPVLAVRRPAGSRPGAAPARVAAQRFPGSAYAPGRAAQASQRRGRWRARHQRRRAASAVSTGRRRPGTAAARTSRRPRRRLRRCAPRASAAPRRAGTAAATLLTAMRRELLRRRGARDARARSRSPLSQRADRRARRACSWICQHTRRPSAAATPCSRSPTTSCAASASARTPAGHARRAGSDERRPPQRLHALQPVSHRHRRRAPAGQAAVPPRRRRRSRADARRAPWCRGARGLELAGSPRPRPQRVGQASPLASRLATAAGRWPPPIPSARRSSPTAAAELRRGTGPAGAGHRPR